MEYILSDHKSAACIFCEKPRLADRDALIVARTERAFVMLNRYPYNNGHLLVAPYAHEASLEGLSAEDAHALMDLVMRSVAVLRESMRPQGFNVGLNLGAAAGAGFEAHVHFHIVPRWSGDTNFMPVLGETRVIPQALEELRAQLEEAWKSI